MSPLAICPPDWPSAAFGNIRSTLMSLKWQEHEQSFLTPSGEYAIFFEHGKWVMTRDDLDSDQLIQVATGETRDELCEVLMQRGLMPEPQAWSEADEGDRKCHEARESA